MRQYLKIDRNFDNKALEIVNENNEVILQVQFDGECAILAGVFTNNDGSKIAFLPGDADYKMIIRRALANETLKTNLKPLFKYPSDIYPGQRSE